MQHDHILKKINFGLGHTPLVHPKGSDSVLQIQSCLICFISIAALPACKISVKKLTIAIVIAKFKYLTFDPLGEVKGGGVKRLHCHANLQALGNHGL